jgi:hypothetical protein
VGRIPGAFTIHGAATSEAAMGRIR